jgi:kynurenine--oxoglutarate transaminase/cysteine-S-conjugate beta-lyase/glutamine--phenylpyruvate transaminase
VEYIQLALDHKPLNLGQGFPDFAAPDYVTKALADIATGENVLLNQYTRGFVSSVFLIFCNKNCIKTI